MLFAAGIGRQATAKIGKQPRVAVGHLVRSVASAAGIGRRAAATATGTPKLRVYPFLMYGWSQEDENGFCRGNAGDG